MCCLTLHRHLPLFTCNRNLVRKPICYYFLKLSTLGAITAQHEPNLQTFVKPVSERFINYIYINVWVLVYTIKIYRWNSWLFVVYRKWYLRIVKSILLTGLLCWFQHNKQDISSYMATSCTYKFYNRSCLNNIFHLFANFVWTFSQQIWKFLILPSLTCISTKYQTF